VTGQGSVTERVRAKLARVRVTAGCCRRAELVGVLRFAGQWHPVAGRVVVSAAVGSLADAVRLQRGLQEVYGCAADVLGPGSRPHRVGGGAQHGAPGTPPGRSGGGHRVLVTTRRGRAGPADRPG